MPFPKIICIRAGATEVPSQIHKKKCKPLPALWHGVIFQVARLVHASASPATILANDHVIQAQLLHAAQNLHLLIPNVLSIQADLQGV